MWTFSQSTGMLRRGDFLSMGYAGREDGKNNPLMQHVYGTGPLPRGFYSIGEPHDDKHGPWSMRLTPDDANDMCGRAGFMIHGDSIMHPGEASEGCIVTDRATRLEIWKSGDRMLEVTE